MPRWSSRSATARGAHASTRWSKACTSIARFIPPPPSATGRSRSTSATSRRWAARPGSRCCRWCCRQTSAPRRLRRARSRARCAGGGMRGVTLAGGNLTRSPGPLVIDVTSIGTVKRAPGADARRRARRATTSTSPGRSAPPRPAWSGCAASSVRERRRRLHGSHRQSCSGRDPGWPSVSHATAGPNRACESARCSAGTGRRAPAWT